MTPTEALHLAQSARADADAATPAPWQFDGRDIDQMTDGGKGYPLGVYPDSKEIALGRCDECGNYCGILEDADATWIASARSTVPLLADAVEKLVAENERLNAVDRIKSDGYCKLEQQLAAMTEARDEACDIAIAWVTAEGPGPAPQRDRIAELRAVGEQP